MAEQLKVFVSHSHEDDDYCRTLVRALRDAGADVWYDEHNMGSGRLGPTIERELRERPIFVVILSPAALRSQWVEDETRWAYGLLRKDSSRVIQPVTGATIQEDDIWLFLQDFKRIETSGCTPYPMADATDRLLRTLGLLPADRSPAPSASQTAESVDDLLKRGTVLFVQKKYAESLPLTERAVKLAPYSFTAWLDLAITFNELGRYEEALTACDRALAINPNDSGPWNFKAKALADLGRYEEAVAAYDRVLTLEPRRILVAITWIDKGNALCMWGRYEEAVSSYDQALAMAPNLVVAWLGKSRAFNALGRTAEAEAAEQRAKELGR